MYCMADDKDLQILIREMHGTVRVLDERSQAILRQAEKTNGRVTKLEELHDDLAKVQENLATKVGIGATLAATAIVAAINKILG